MQNVFDNGYLFVQVFGRFCAGCLVRIVHFVSERGRSRIEGRRGERRLAVLQNVKKIAEKAEYGGNILFFVVYERTVYKSEI